MQDNYDTILAQDGEDVPYPEEVNNSLQFSQDGKEDAVSGKELPYAPSSASDSEGEEENPYETKDEKEEIDYSRVAAEDLAEIKRLFPDFSELEDIRQLNNASRFGELRDAGLSVSEALAATNMDRMIASLAKRISRSDGKSHLRSAVPSASSLQRSRMSAEELHSARELFGSLSDKELEHLYKRATS